MIQGTVWLNLSTLGCPMKTKGELGENYSAEGEECGRYVNIWQFNIRSLAPMTC